MSRPRFADPAAGIAARPRPASSSSDERSPRYRAAATATDADAGNAAAARELRRLETGQVAREVTDRLACADLRKREQALEAARRQHAVHVRVPVRAARDAEQYVVGMIAKAEARRTREMRRLELEMYPRAVPTILARSRELAEVRRQREQEERRTKEDAEAAASRKRKGNSKPLARGDSLSPASSAARRRCRPPLAEASRDAVNTSSHDNNGGHGAGSARRGMEVGGSGYFRPCGAVHRTGVAADLFLVSMPSQRCPSPRPSAPLSESDRLKRLTELAVPRRSASSDRRAEALQKGRGKSEPEDKWASP